MENKQVMNYWREQMDSKSFQKKEQKDIEQRDAEKHIQRMNSITYQQK